MMMSLQKLLNFIILATMLALVSCVGTVQDAASPSGLQNVVPPTEFSFTGIITARPISHDKIELEFLPAQGSTSDFTYKLYVNDQLNPVTVDPLALVSAPGGRLMYTVTNLAINTEYKFKLTASNSKTAAVSKNENEIFARTFDNKVANFMGVSKLTLTPGNTQGAVTVDWIASTFNGVLIADSFDPAYYEVTYISEIGGLANLNNTAYTGTDRKIVLVPTPPARATAISNPTTTIIDSLQANTRYYIQVRAINTLYQNYDDDPSITTIPVNKESNTRYLTIKTDANSNFSDFRQDNVVLANAPAQDAFDKIDIYWQPGSGIVNHYRIYVNEYTGSGDPAADDTLDDATITARNTANNYISVSSSTTNRRVSGLNSYKDYQVKVVLCKVADCNVTTGAIISNLKSINTHPTLAPFNGINSISAPASYAERDIVKLNFDAPLVSSGYATGMEFYCVNPLDKSQRVLFVGNNTISGSGIPACEGLSLVGAAPNFATMSTFVFQKVKGVVADGANQYCFTATPVINAAVVVRLDNTTLVDKTRCSYPEVKPPTLPQFPGLKTSCPITGTTATVSWDLPTGGIYSGFKVFWKEKSDAYKFSFPTAITSAVTVPPTNPITLSTEYRQSTVLTDSTTSYAVTDLIPGKTYQIGVLAGVDISGTADLDLYSEYNLQVRDCIVPLPIPTFKGFTRVLALGPKVDGRVPNDNTTKTSPTSAWIYEAINSDGIPYETYLDPNGHPNTSATYFQTPPGRDYSSFTTAFDGKGDGTAYGNMSRTGIVSLAWEEVQMDYPTADTYFAAHMPVVDSVGRLNRTYGYKVYRSSDNKLSWVDLTATTGLIWTMSYTYHKRPNDAGTTVRMGFFTDYSVQALEEYHDTANKRDLERARVYHYKIVPYFDGKALTYASSNKHIIKVTLPPPNMALVHRWMANRNRCMELGKTPDISNNYTCPYNGIGAYPATVPNRSGETVLDQAGDLLIDRFELGCRFTRGDRNATAESSASYFDMPVGARRNAGTDINFFPLFKGYQSAGGSSDGRKFMGCTGINSDSRGSTGATSEYAVGFKSEYQYMLQGDCVGSNAALLSSDPCLAANAYTNGEYSAYVFNTPGADNDPAGPAPDCSDTSNMPNKKYMKNWLMGYYAPNKVIQSEWLGVYYNSGPSSLVSGDFSAPVEGPALNNVAGSQIISTADYGGGSRTSSQCQINLAAIGADGYMKPRWMNLNALALNNSLQNRITYKGTNGDLLSKTVDDLAAIHFNPTTAAQATFYNGEVGNVSNQAGADWLLPESFLRTSNRYRSTTRLAKIMTSNSSKLPPVGRLELQAVHNICMNSFVQVLIATDGATQISQTEAVKAKRPVRRPESVSAAAWPETYNSAQVSSYEYSSTAGSCNTPAKGILGFSLSKGQLYRNNMPSDNNSNFPGGMPNGPLITGSSPYSFYGSENAGSHTGNCISRYGIQDLVGNMVEYNSEKVFCDYQLDRSFVGETSGSWTPTNIQNGGSGGPNFPFFNNPSENYYWGILSSGVLSNGTPIQFKKRLADGVTLVNLDAKPYVEISTSSGYCSVVDNTPGRRTNGADSIYHDVSGTWMSVFPGGTLNTTMVAKTNPRDQESINGWRNGDGRFLDFGPNGIGASLNYQKTMSMDLANIIANSQGESKSKYFNPIIGLPLRCAGTSCDSPDPLQLSDNTSLTTTDLALNIDTSGGDFMPASGNDNFYIGNSEAWNPGLSEYTYSNMTGGSASVVPASGYSATTINLYSELQVDGSGAGTSFGNILVYPTSFQPGSSVAYHRLSWTIERNSEFGIKSGGSGNTIKSGRYTSSIVPEYSGTEDVQSGARCAILINQDP